MAMRPERTPGIQEDAPEAAIGANVVRLAPRSDLFRDDAIRSIEQRALTYLRAGIPVHLRGPAGTGKSTLAVQIAALLGRPAVLIAGDAQMSSSDLVGREGGRREKVTVDKFIHNVHKRELETSSVWIDSFLTQAVIEGYTLVYDEFTRSPPAANNALLMALEERALIVPGRDQAEARIDAHPDFRAIFTSNPSDYAGVQTPADALIDRMITLDLQSHDFETEVGIVSQKSGLDVGRSSQIVSLVRTFREEAAGSKASIRSAIIMARIVSAEKMSVAVSDPAFLQLALDALHSRWSEGAGDRDKRAFVKRLSTLLEDKAA
ncbi:MAG: gas vesicle protein GvpN [Pseudomonadota bacterium]